MLTHMKTTLELPDELLMEAKAVALRRKTTLKAMIEHSLRREIGEELPTGTGALIELNTHGFPVLKRQNRGGQRVTSERVYTFLDEEIG